MSEKIMLYGCGIILKSDKGLMYTAQCGGHNCYQENVRGFIIPADPLNDGKLIQEAVGAYLDTTYNGWGGDGLTDDDVATIESLLKQSSFRVEVDRSRLNKSYEAFVHVLIENPKSRFAHWGDEDIFEAALFAENSD